ncbi:MAG: Fic family protein [Candidatus Eremiobacterota bacterium]
MRGRWSLPVGGAARGAPPPSVETLRRVRGLPDPGALDAAAARPAMTFGGEDLYPDIPSKAAAWMHSLVMNHPFVDGNKRVGAHAAILFLLANEWKIAIESKDLEEITLSVA